MSDKDQNDSTEELKKLLESRLSQFRKRSGEKEEAKDQSSSSATNDKEDKKDDKQADSSSSSFWNRSNDKDSNDRNERQEEQRSYSNNDDRNQDKKSKFNFNFNFGGGNKNNDSNNNGSNNNGNKGNGLINKLNKAGKAGLGIAFLAVTVSFVATGFYTVNETELGVVQRLGAYYQTTTPGLNWRIPVIDKVSLVNVQRVNEAKLEGTMLTKDENVVNVSMTIQYRIEDPRSWLFNIDNPLITLKEASESSLRFVIGHMNMDDILTTGRSEVREKTRQELTTVLDRYKTGIQIVDVNFQSARPPEEVKEAFDDAIKAQEDEHRYIREAEAYQRSKEPISRGQAIQITTAAEGYAKEVVARAQEHVAQFNNLLPQYLANPEVFKERLYLDYMSDFYGNTPKVIVQDGINLNFLSLDKLLTPGYRPLADNPLEINFRAATSQYDYQYNSGSFSKGVPTHRSEYSLTNEQGTSGLAPQSSRFNSVPNRNDAAPARQSSAPSSPAPSRFNAPDSIRQTTPQRGN